MHISLILHMYTSDTQRYNSDKRTNSVVQAQLGIVIYQLYLFIYLLICMLNYLFIRLVIYLPTYCFMYLLGYLFIGLC